MAPARANAAGGAEQRFDLEQDPLERRDLMLHGEHREQRDRLRAETVRRHADRGGQALADGDMAARPVREETTARRRSRARPGYHTDHRGLDVCHGPGQRL